jgi:hypothetical protein
MTDAYLPLPPPAPALPVSPAVPPPVPLLPAPAAPAPDGLAPPAPAEPVVPVDAAPLLVPVDPVPLPLFERIDDGLWSRTQSLIARPVRLTHSFGMSLRIVEPGGVVASAGIVLLFVDCAPAVVAIASDIAAASSSSFHVFIVHS